MKKVKSLAIILILIACIPLLSGCWDKRELEQHVLIKGIGVDQTENNRIKLSVQTVKAGGGGRGGGQNQTPTGGNLTEVITSTGFSLYEANRNMVKQTGRRPFYGHSEIIVFGEELARKGIGPFLDYFLREKEIRGRSRILVSKKKEAHKILDSHHTVEDISASGINRMVNGISITGVVITTDFIRFLTDLLSETKDPVASSIELRKGGPTTEKQGQQKSGKNLLLSEGGAMFKDDRLVDFLTRRETRGYNWVTGPEEIRGPIMVNIGKNKEDGKIAIRIFNTKSSIEPSYKNKKFSVTIKIKTDGAIEEDFGQEINITREVNIEQINSRFAQVIKNEILNTLKKSRKYRADILGLGEAINRKFPQEFKKIKAQWDEIYVNLPVNFEIKAQIRRTGMIRKGLGIMTREKELN